MCICLQLFHLHLAGQKNCQSTLQKYEIYAGWNDQARNAFCHIVISISHTKNVPGYSLGNILLKYSTKLKQKKQLWVFIFIKYYNFEAFRYLLIEHKPYNWEECNACNSFIRLDIKIVQRKYLKYIFNARFND